MISNVRHQMYGNAAAERGNSVRNKDTKLHLGIWASNSVGHVDKNTQETV